jgi:hypothetical protein
MKMMTSCKNDSTPFGSIKVRQHPYHSVSSPTHRYKYPASNIDISINPALAVHRCYRACYASVVHAILYIRRTSHFNSSAQHPKSSTMKLLIRKVVFCPLPDRLEYIGFR